MRTSSNMVLPILVSSLAIGLAALLAVTGAEASTPAAPAVAVICE